MSEAAAPPPPPPPADPQESRLRQELALIKERWLKNKAEDISYTKEAFFDQYNLITLGGLAAITLTSLIIMPLATPLLGSLLAAWEVCWLGIAPSSERFRRSVRARRNATTLEVRDERRKGILDKLPKDLRAQYDATAAIVKEIRGHAQAAQEGELEVFEDTLAKLDYLLEEYARMLLAVRQLDENLRAPEAGTLERRAQALAREVEATEAGRLKTAKEKNLLVLRQRAERLAKSREEREYLAVSLETIENTLKLVRDQVVAATSAQGIASSIDQVVLEVGRHRDHMQHVEAQLEQHAGEPLEASSLSEAPRELEPDGTAARGKDDEKERWRKALEG